MPEFPLHPATEDNEVLNITFKYPDFSFEGVVAGAIASSN
jgi:hypothetical protein